MRFGLVIYGSLDVLSGGYLYDRRLVERLRARGHSVQIIARPWRSYARRVLDNLSPAWRAALKDAPVDVLLQDELNHPSLAGVNGALRGRNHPPIVSIVHHLRADEQRPAWQNAITRWVERRYLASVDGFIFNSHTTRRAVQTLLGAGGEPPPATPTDTQPPAALPPWRVAYPAGDALSPGITSPEIAARAAQPGPLRLVFVGNWMARKGLHTLLHALLRLPADAYRLEVVGDDEFDPAYSRRIRRIWAGSPTLQAAARLRHRLPDAELRQVLRQAHVLVVPSQYEGFGIVYLEGMGYGLPAIAGAAGGASEIITHGVDGFLTPPEDPAQLAHLIDQLHRDRALLERMALAAHQRYLRHPSWRVSMDGAVDFLERFNPHRRAT
jgi:glycosyltransferase involved in cell wall biosynthesis